MGPGRHNHLPIELNAFNNAMHPPAWAAPKRERYRYLQTVMLSIIAISFSWWALTAAFPYQSSLQKPLSFTENGSFQITIFEDLHFGEVAWLDWGEVQDDNSTIVMNRVLDAESPQLVVFNGDLITGDDTFLGNSTRYLDRIVEPLLSRGLTWASAYGNHDGQYNLSGHDLLARERHFQNARTTQMVFGEGVGTTNYYLPVYGSNCTSGQNCSCTPEMLLWFFDSRGGWEFQQKDGNDKLVTRRNWVDHSVVDWFTNTNTELYHLHNKTIPSLAFVHHPINASRAFQIQHGVDPNRQPGINDDYPLAGQAEGWCEDGTHGDDCSYGGQDTPFTKALTSTPGLMAVFSGHDHGITWCYKWDTKFQSMTVAGNGINLCFGQHTGYGGYGTWARGSRQVLVTEEMLKTFEAETWIRLERGEVVEHVSLNSTYGDDRYPATPNWRSTGPDDEYFFDDGK